MFKRTALAVLVLAALPMQANAADGMFRLDAHVSTLGGGLEIGAPLSERYTARLGFNTFKASGNTDSGGLNYTGDLKLSSVSAMMDWRPWNGVTHLTAGVIFNSNKLELNAAATAGTVYNINGFDYTANTGDAINTTVDFNKVSPYLGIGWSGQPKKQGFSFSSDIGILFQGSPKATVTASGSWAGTGGKTVTDLVADAQSQLNSDLSNFKYYPVISFGIGYTF
ncbi:MAG: hypothetical protein PHH36_03765 [Sideroxydans sp.]|nr:hypothetical protein [Sideroxydans sp.]